MKASLLLLALLLALNISGYCQQPARNIYLETIIQAPVEKVWKTWTTEKGLESFLAPESKIELKVGGSLSIYFHPKAPPRQRGAENLHILAVQNNKMFSFSWKNPADFPEIGNQQTHVTLKFFPAGNSANQTKLVLIHDGWGDGALWDQAYQYFLKEWKDTVLFRLNYLFEKGPINWNYPPKNTGKYNILVH